MKIGENGCKLGASRVYCVYKSELRKAFVTSFIVASSTERLKPKTEHASQRVRMVHLCGSSTMRKLTDKLMTMPMDECLSKTVHLKGTTKLFCTGFAEWASEIKEPRLEYKDQYWMWMVCVINEPTVLFSESRPSSAR